MRVLYTCMASIHFFHMKTRHGQDRSMRRVPIFFGDPQGQVELQHGKEGIKRVARTQESVLFMMLPLPQITATSAKRDN